MTTDNAKLPLLNDWRQGDFVLAPIEFPFVTIDDQQQQQFGLLEARGAVVISQTCDIVRDIADRPHVQIAALVQANDNEIKDIQKRLRPRFGHIGGLPHGLAVDFDIVTLADKKLVATWDRNAGCQRDDEVLKFAEALSRHKKRFAFPDEIVPELGKIRDYVRSNHRKNSARGSMLRAIEQIVLRCPDWSNPRAELEVIGILLDEVDSADRDSWPEDDLKKIVLGISSDAIFRLSTQDDLTAREFREAARLDLDGLSDS